ncbi:MAG: hypothetical protein KJN94_08760 [Gammaproteobacteria bacterium]|nr:hypothetical protein [Gammaproteobacteria bacterium]NNK33723.1 hypothetical protein [Xanthomonadales bacterium]
MTERSCGPCTACCEGWLMSRHIEMSPGQPCQHCTRQGCAIYDERPEDPCRTFVCGWLQADSPLPEQLRPDLSGVVVMLDRKWRGRRIIKATPAGWTIPPDTLEKLMALARERSLPLIYLENLQKDGRYIGYRQMGYGPPEFVQAVQRSIGPSDIRVI